METTPKTAIFRHIRRFWETPSPTPKTHYSNGKLPRKGMRVFFISKSVVFFSLRVYHARNGSSLSRQGLLSSACTSACTSASASLSTSKVLPRRPRRPRRPRNQGLASSLATPSLSSLVVSLCSGSSSSSVSREPSLVSPSSVSSLLGNNIKSFCKGLLVFDECRYPTARLSRVSRSIERLIKGAHLAKLAAPVFLEVFPQGQLLRCYSEHRPYPGHRRWRLVVRCIEVLGLTLGLVSSARWRVPTTCRKADYS